MSSKKRLCSTVELLSVVRVILFNNVFFNFQGGEGFEALKLQNFKLLCVRDISRPFQTSEKKLFPEVFSKRNSSYIFGF